MHSFRDNRLRDHRLPMSTAWLLNDIAEYKGKQERLSRQPQQARKAGLAGSGFAPCWPT